MKKIRSGQRGLFRESDALELLTWAKELGCNFVRFGCIIRSQRVHGQTGRKKWGSLVLGRNTGVSAYWVLRSGAYAVRKNRSHDERNDSKGQEPLRSCHLEPLEWDLRFNAQPQPRLSLTCPANAECLNSTRLITSPICSQGYENNTLKCLGPALFLFRSSCRSMNTWGWYSPWQGRPGECVHMEIDLRR